MEYFIAGSIFCSLIAAFILLTADTPFQRYANRLFALYLLASSYCALLFILVNTGSIEKIPHLFKTAAPFNFILPPLAYLYIRAVLEDETRFRKTDILHFLPFLFFTISYIPFFVLPVDTKLKLISAAKTNATIQLGWIPENLQFNVRVLQTGMYTFIQWRLILHFKRRNIDVRLKAFTNQVFNWLKAIATVNALYFVGFIPLVVFGIFSDQSLPLDIIFNISILIVSMAFFSLTCYLLLNPAVLYGIDQRYSIKSEHVKEATVKLQIDISNTFEREQQILQEYFETSKPYLKSGLSLADVSVATGIPPRSISFILNTQRGVRFSDFVNQFRMKEAMEAIKQGYLGAYTLTSLAEKVGFSSAKTLARTFKKELNMTPMEYASGGKVME